MSDEYATSASVYDAIYTSRKDYSREAKRVHELIQAHKHTDGNTMLDVACGTGLHDQFLTEWYQLEGLDFSPAMLAEARKLVPDVVFHEGDMSNFDLGKQYDAVTCLFSAIGHMTTLDRLHAAIACMARHLKPGGVLIVEPFVDPRQWVSGSVHVDLVGDKKIARVTTSELAGHVAHLDMLHFTDWDEDAGTAKFHRAISKVAMYTADEFNTAFANAGLDVFHDLEGLMGRGLYIGKLSRPALAVSS